MKTKRYTVDQLREGMILGRDIYKKDMSVLLGEGTVLTQKMIDSLAERDVLFVHVQIGEAAEPRRAPIEQPPEEHLEAEAPKGQEAVSAGEAAAEEETGEEEPPAPKAPLAFPPQESLFDDSFTGQYKACFSALQELYAEARRHVRIDADAAESLAQDILQLCSKVKSIVHIYNMEVAEVDYSFHHSMRIAILASFMGQWLKMRSSERSRLVMAGFLLDIGSTRIDTTFLDMQGYYSSAERRLMQKHPRLGSTLITRSPRLAEDVQVSGAVLQHHERSDGSGYPAGIKGEAICDFARILAILDMYDAMASNRAYAKKRSPFDAIRILSHDIAHGRLDTEYGVCFIHHVYQSLNGSWVKLTDGGKGKIVYIDESRIDALPVVQTTEGSFLDLNKQQDIKVESLLTSDEMEMG